MDRRKYRGYIVPNPESHGTNDKWLIRFPDFPTIELKAGNEALDPTGIIVERSCSAILNVVFSMLQHGTLVPVPHEPIKFTMFIEVEIDVEALQSVCKLPN